MLNWMENLMLLDSWVFRFSINDIWNADVLKVRLQMQLVGQRGPLSGMVSSHTFRLCFYLFIFHMLWLKCVIKWTQGQLFVQALRNEGPKSLYLGLTPALTRSVLYGGLRLGLYEPSKYACEWAFGSTNIFFKIACGAFSGATATALTNPTEVLKVQFD